MKKLLTLLLGGMLLIGLMGLPVARAEEMEAFERVLSLDEALLDLSRGDMVTLDAWHSGYRDEPVFFAWIAYVDLDRDGEIEAVLAFDLSGSEQGFLVLDLWEGQVLGHELVSRGLKELKADGSFSYASGAMDNGCGWYNLASGVTEVVPHSWMASTSEGGVQYFAGGQPSDEDGFFRALAAQNEKPGADWLPLARDGRGAYDIDRASAGQGFLRADAALETGAVVHAMLTETAPGQYAIQISLALGADYTTLDDITSFNLYLNAAPAIPVPAYWDAGNVLGAPTTFSAAFVFAEDILLAWLVPVTQRGGEMVDGTIGLK